MAKTVLITGATSGFGKACAEYFAEKGWQLILTGRRTERLEELRQQLGSSVSKIITLDVRDRTAVEAELGNLGDVDLLLNNAGLALGLEPSWEVSLDDWDTMVDTNIKGLTYCTRVLLPQMVKRNSGHIINIGSVAANWPYPGGNVYGGTKAFVQQFSRNLRADLIGHDVRVTVIEPGMAESEFSNIRFKGDADKAAQVYAGTRSLTPRDIAEIVYWTAERPAHVNVNTLEVMCIDQAWNPFAVHRKDK